MNKLNLRLAKLISPYQENLLEIDQGGKFMGYAFTVLLQEDFVAT